MLARVLGLPSFATTASGGAAVLFSEACQFCPLLSSEHGNFCLPDLPPAACLPWWRVYPTSGNEPPQIECVHARRKHLHNCIGRGHESVCQNPNPGTVFIYNRVHLLLAMVTTTFHPSIKEITSLIHHASYASAMANIAASSSGVRTADIAFEPSLIYFALALRLTVIKIMTSAVLLRIA